MKQNFLNRMQFIRPRHLFLIFLFLSVIMVSSALIELNESKKELLDLMRRQSFTLTETILTAADNTLSTNILVEELIENRLLNNAAVIRDLYESGNISNSALKRIAEQNNLYRINIFNRNGEKIFSSQTEIHEGLTSKTDPAEYLSPIFNEETDTLLIGLKAARFQEGFRFSVALASQNRSAVLVNINAEQLLLFRRQIGIGSLIQNAAANPGMLYAAIQDTSGILAASGNITELERILNSEFLLSSLTDSTFKTRTTLFDSVKVFEAVHPFYFEGETIGLFRIGLSLEALDAINSRIYRRIIIITVILLAVGFIVFTFLMISQNYDIVRRQYQSIETYSQNIIQNVSDAIIVFRYSGGIEVFNEAAERIFNVQSEKIIGKEIKDFLTSNGCPQIISAEFSMQEVECRLNDQPKYLLVSQNKLAEESGEPIIILVLRDLTEQKRLEEQIERRERMSALGQLASGVAHEIRNPLNAIGTVVQQLNRDFIPAANTEEYDDLTKMVYGEVKRINQTIENFLRFARPEPLKPEWFEIASLFDDLKTEYGKFLREKKIDLHLNLNWAGKVNWDKRKMRQLFINLFENSAQALIPGGKIEIIINKIDNEILEIHVSDDGPGIPKEIRDKIFNLYFTTKASGTGIGLSIVQRIADEHGGVIFVESEPGKGSDFILQIPKSAERSSSIITDEEIH